MHVHQLEHELFDLSANGARGLVARALMSSVDATRSVNSTVTVPSGIGGASTLSQLGTGRGAFGRYRFGWRPST